MLTSIFFQVNLVNPIRGKPLNDVFGKHTAIQPYLHNHQNSFHKITHIFCIENCYVWCCWSSMHLTPGHLVTWWHGPRAQVDTIRHTVTPQTVTQPAELRQCGDHGQWREPGTSRVEWCELENVSARDHSARCPPTIARNLEKVGGSVICG